MKSNILVKGVLHRMAGLDIPNGFAGKVISDCIDIAIDKIKKADKNRKSKNQTIETRIYQVTIDALNEFPYNKYKKEEKVYDAAESILKELKRGNRDYQEAIKSGLKMLVSQVTDDICKDFLKTLCYEICKDENDVLYKGIALIQQEQLNENVNEGFKDNNRSHEETHKKLDEIQEDINGLKERQSMTRNYEPENANRIPIINRAEEYAKKWNKNVFLNDFNVEDQNAGVNIKLKDIYLEEHLPHYIWKTNTKPSDKLKNLLKKHIIDNNERKMLLILGQPGIGKSTLITWVMANLVEKKEQVLVYQFASDLGKVNWQSKNLLDNIFTLIGLKYGELEGKTLILDGFDEIYINGDRERVLRNMNWELKWMNIQKFSLIITCRENYVDQYDLKNIEYIILQAWNEEQIKSFCEVYERKNARKSSEVVDNKNLEAKINKILENKEIFGIPLILYMVLALSVDIEKNISKMYIYDQIFSLEKGVIYDRCYDREHRINSPRIKEYIYQISQRIAFWIFENNADKASISQEKFKEICDNVMSEAREKNEYIHRDTLIGNYFASIKHCEGVWADELQFIHRSIYEYFVVVYFFENIYRLKSIEEIAGKLGELLKDGYLSDHILEFIKYKFDNIKKYSLQNTLKEIFQIMLRDGMSYHIGTPILNVVSREMNIFSNMLKIVCLWNARLGELNEKIITYLLYNRKKNLNLRGIRLIGDINLSRIYLEDANLENAYFGYKQYKISNGWRKEIVDLREANLKGANLKRAQLQGIYLESANLENANLEEANLLGARLKGINLKNANLKNTIFDERQIGWLHKKYNISNSRVYIFQTKEIISYKKYSVNKLKKTFYRNFKAFD